MAEMATWDDLLADLRRRAADPRTRNDMAGYLGADPLPPVAVAKYVDGAERRLGFALPKLLRRLYLEVADGGFGPGYGILPLGDSGEEETLVGGRSVARALPRWPARLVPFVHWGCDVWSCVDCAHPEGAIVHFAGKRLAETDDTLGGWLTQWTSGRRLWDGMWIGDAVGAGERLRGRVIALGDE
jgi:hypothetical protein